MDTKLATTGRAVETTLKARFLSKPTVERLKRDGSNIDEWIKGINTIGLMVFGICEFTHNIANLQELKNNKSIIA